MENFIHQRIYDEEVVILCQKLIRRAFVLDRLPRQHVAQPVPDNFLHSCIAVQAEAQNVVEVGTTDGIQDC